MMRGRAPLSSDESSFIALRKNISEIAYPSGTRAGRGLVIGTLAGLVAGVGLGAIAGPGLSSRSDLTTGGWIRVFGLMGMIGGSGIGTVIGVLTPGWRRIE